MADRVRIVAHRDSSTSNRKEFGKYNYTGPITTLEECARIMGISTQQARYYHANALQKLRAALSAYGYHREMA